MAAMPRPGHPAFGQQYLQIGISRSLAFNQPHGIDIAIGCEPAAIGIGIGYRCRQADTLHLRADRLQPCQTERQQVATL